jgi:hypothetical protein
MSKISKLAECLKIAQTDEQACFAGEKPEGGKLSTGLSPESVDRIQLEFDCGSGQRG